MEKKIKLFRRLEIETQSTCNRHCSTCLRNSIPDRESVASWFTKNQLSLQDIERVLQESQAAGFRGEVCLSHYNEPLQDERIVEIAKMVRSMGFSRLFFCTNGDYLTEDLAAQLDGLLDDAGIALYMEDPVRSKRREWIKGLFKKTRINISNGEHMVTHYSPLIETGSLVKANRSNPCHHPTVRMIVNHRGQMLLCCDDLTGNFDLGTIHESTIEQLWFSERHQNYVIQLSRRGGRSVHPHCLSCPRAGLVMGIPRKLAKRSEKKEVRVATHIPVLEICFQHFQINRVLEHGMGKSSTAFFHKCKSLDFILSLEDDLAWKVCADCDYSLPKHTVASYTCKSDIALCLGYAFNPETALVFLDGPHNQRGEIFESALESKISHIVEHDTESLNDDEMKIRRTKAESAGYTCLTYTGLNPETTLYTRKQFSHPEFVPVISIRS